MENIKEIFRQVQDGKITMSKWASMEYKNGKPCTHIGCLNHYSYPCEGCLRLGGVEPKALDFVKFIAQMHIPPEDCLYDNITVDIKISWIRAARMMVYGGD